MNAYAAIRAEARRRRQALLESTAHEAVQGEGIDPAEFRRQLEALDALADLRSLPEWILSASLPLVVAVLLLLPLWWIRQPEPAVELSVRASRVVLDLDRAKELDLGRLPPAKALHAEGLTAVASDAGGLRLESRDGRATWGIKGSLHVSHVILRPSAAQTPDGPPRLIVARKAEGGQVATERLPLQLSASVGRGATAVWRDGRSERETTLEEASLELSGGPATKLYFAFEKETAQLPILRPRAIAFRDTAFDAEGRRLALPSIVEGQLVLAGTGRRHALARDAELMLDGLDGNVLVSLEGDGLRVAYAGRARVVSLGTEQTLMRDLRPTLAEWMSRDSILPLAWSGFVFLAGLAWTVRRFVRKPASL